MEVKILEAPSPVLSYLMQSYYWRGEMILLSRNIVVLISRFKSKKLFNFLYDIMNDDLHKSHLCVNRYFGSLSMAS